MHNNYQQISVLPVLARMLEKLCAIGSSPSSVKTEILFLRISLVFDLNPAVSTLSSQPLGYGWKKLTMVVWWVPYW